MSLEGFKNPVSSQTDKLMAATKVSDYLGLKHCRKAQKRYEINVWKLEVDLF